MCKCNFAAFITGCQSIDADLVRFISNQKTMTALERPLFMRHNYIFIAKEVIAAKIKGNTAKVKALLEEGTLNPSPGKVRDPKFQENEFFDPRDLVQVKYEMLRRVSVENSSVTEATEEYGVSRPTY